jgi:putative redox protein
LTAHLALPAVVPAPAVVLCHGFPTGPKGAAASAATYPELADRIARDAGWVALAFNARGTGTSQGDFSVAGWMADIGAAVATVAERPDTRGVFLVGIGEGGTLALCVAAADERVRGCAVLAAPAAFREWARDPSRLLALARESGMVRTPGFPENVGAWGRAIGQVDAVVAARRLGDRPLLVVSGGDDLRVSVDEARAIADAAGERAERRFLLAAGHELRHDPRAIASLLGWLDRHTG